MYALLLFQIIEDGTLISSLQAIDAVISSELTLPAIFTSDCSDGFEWEKRQREREAMLEKARIAERKALEVCFVFAQFLPSFPSALT